MNLTYLKYFLELAKIQHYGRAAELLGISQPGLSHAIAALEKELGMPLFKKDGRNIALNRFGKMLMPEAEKILSMTENCEEQFRLLRDGGGPLRIAAIRPLTTKVVPALVRDYVRQSGKQGQKFLFETRVSGEVIEELKNGGCDIGFCSMIEREPELEMVPVQRQRMVVIVPKGHRFWCRDQVPLEETLNEPQILFSPKSGLRKKMDRFFQENGFKTLEILHNNCALYGDVALCGTRGWFYEEDQQGHNEKVFKRELIRLEASLKAGGEREKLCFLHYPPLYQGYRCPEIIALLERYGVKSCYYGHLHGGSHRLAVEGRQGSVEYHLVSADYLDFTPRRVLD